MTSALLPVAFFLAALLTPVDESGFAKLTAAHKGKVVLYDFWATWCGGCREEMPALVKLQAKLKARGFDLVTISADDPDMDAAAAKMVKEFGAPLPAYRREAKKDEQFINQVDPKWSGALPALFLYDRSGRKAASFFGTTEVKTLEAQINKLL